MSMMTSALSGEVSQRRATPAIALRAETFRPGSSSATITKGALISTMASRPTHRPSSRRLALVTLA